MHVLRLGFGAAWATCSSGRPARLHTISLISLLVKPSSDTPRFQQLLRAHLAQDGHGQSPSDHLQLPLQTCPDLLCRSAVATGACLPACTCVHSRCGVAAAAATNERLHSAGARLPRSPPAADPCRHRSNAPGGLQEGIPPVCRRLRRRQDARRPDRRKRRNDAHAPPCRAPACCGWTAPAPSGCTHTPHQQRQPSSTDLPPTPTPPQPPTHQSRRCRHCTTAVWPPAWMGTLSGPWKMGWRAQSWRPSMLTPTLCWGGCTWRGGSTPRRAPAFSRRCNSSPITKVSGGRSERWQVGCLARGVPAARGLGALCAAPLKCALLRCLAA